ncbi:MAG: hypothetical protein K0R46_1853 [Herbinix sp.]|nr:hypothetical protein [Herbinix sp.]
MSIIKCHECNGDVSDSAKTCPHCGVKIKETNTIKVIIISILFVLLVSLIVFLVYKSVYGKPEELSKSAYQYGISALDISDKYLDGYYDDDTAREMLYNVYYKLESLYEEDDNTYTLGLNAEVLGVITYILAGTESDVIDARNNLADSLNRKNR